MDTGTAIAIWMPIIVIFLIILPQQARIKMIAKHKITKRRNLTMNHDLVKGYIGKNCTISTGSFGANVTGIIKQVQEGWMEVEDKKGKKYLLNLEYVVGMYEA